MILENEVIDNILREIKSNNIGWIVKPNFNYDADDAEVGEIYEKEMAANVKGFEFWFLLEIENDNVITDNHSISVHGMFYDAEIEGQSNLIAMALIEQTKCRHYRETFSADEAMERYLRKK